MKSSRVLLAVAVVVLGACGAEQGPVEVVRSFMTAVENLNVAAAQSLACEAQWGDVQDGLGPFGDAAKLGEAFEMSFGDLSFQEVSNDGNAAVVHVSGTVMLSFLGRQEEQPVDEDHLVIKEDGRWVVCDP